MPWNQTQGYHGGVAKVIHV
ncbi:uncharacterized protein FTOL_13930 [Fusarium torulosum]|uniref:Uncharacterized protein n=1 Tax=Fusarium torulosum TaxID=33205 RepID=A0AAE8MQB4_9HYPO|nr:uncharacterized protein FTOL_13930 [Fusarium torulosum]